jgi:hypothetical protein
VGELAGVVAEDLELKLLLLYLESIRDPVALAELARVSRDRGPSVVALKSGRTETCDQAAARKLARWPTRTVSSMPSCARTGSGGHATRRRWCALPSSS